MVDGTQAVRRLRSGAGHHQLENDHEYRGAADRDRDRERVQPGAAAAEDRKKQESQGAHHDLASHQREHVGQQRQGPVTITDDLPRHGPVESDRASTMGSDPQPARAESTQDTQERDERLEQGGCPAGYHSLLTRRHRAGAVLPHAARSAGSGPAVVTTSVESERCRAPAAGTKDSAITTSVISSRCADTETTAITTPRPTGPTR